MAAEFVCENPKGETRNLTLRPDPQGGRGKVEAGASLALLRRKVYRMRFAMSNTKGNMSVGTILPAYTVESC